MGVAETGHRVAVEEVDRQPIATRADVRCDVGEFVTQVVAPGDVPDDIVGAVLQVDGCQQAVSAAEVF